MYRLGFVWIEQAATPNLLFRAGFENEVLHCIEIVLGSVKWEGGTGSLCNNFLVTVALLWLGSRRE